MPVIGSVNYVFKGKEHGIILAIMGFVSLGPVLLRCYRWLFLPGFISASVLVYDFINFSTAMTALKTVQWEIGLPVMAAGIILMIIAASLPPYLPSSVTSGPVER
jgi:hypothetical protein